jgi:Kae1-associated kinase Bud32
VDNEKIIYQGAEAKIILGDYFGRKVIQKKRIKKGYRIKDLDNKLILSRTKEEAKLMIEARMKGISTPVIYDVDIPEGIITMEYLDGKRIKDIFNHISENNRRDICKKIGRNIAIFHNSGIIHGDITTSNMILLDDKIHFIDFGLGEKNNELEAKGVDLHVLMEAIESTHSRFSSCFDYVLEGYKSELKSDADLIINKIDEIIKRGRYR